MRMRRPLAFLGLAALAVFPALALAYDLPFNPDDLNTSLAAIFDAALHGHADLAVVFASIVLVEVLKRLVGKKVDAVLGDVGGTVFSFAVITLTFMAGSMVGGVHLSVPLIVGAAGVSFKSIGGYVFLKRVVARLLIVLLPHMDAVFGQIPVVGTLVKWAVAKWAKDNATDAPPPAPPVDPSLG